MAISDLYRTELSKRLQYIYEKAVKKIFTNLFYCCNDYDFARSACA